MREDVTDAHSVYIAFLRWPAERLLLESILASVGLSPMIRPDVVGLSGLRHRNVLVGSNETRKHAVIVQRGMERAYSARHSGDPPKDDPLEAVLMSATRLEIAQREDLIRREVLFQGYDIAGRLQSDGYTCDLLFFLNSAPLHNLGFDRYDWTTGQFIPTRNKQVVPTGLAVMQTVSVNPIPRIQRAELAQNALGIGACFLALDDFTSDQLARMTHRTDGETVAEAREILTKLRVYQYFAPPADEFVLSLAALPLPASPEVLIAAGRLSSELHHPLAHPALLHGVNKDNPLEVAQALAQEGRLHYKGTIAYPTSSGARVTHEIETRPQQSWIKKVGSLVGLLGKIRGLAGSP